MVRSTEMDDAAWTYAVRYKASRRELGECLAMGALCREHGDFLQRPFRNGMDHDLPNPID
jgi:hypothetical protein